jgi:phage shock protein PspC (stress-responsive transcriptional regulator)
VEHLGCGCNVPALQGNATLFDAWKQGIDRLAKVDNIECLQVGGVMAGFLKVNNVDPTLIKVGMGIQI